MARPVRVAGSWVASLLLAGLLTVLAVAPVAAEQLALDPAKVGWRTLHYKASKLLVTARASAELTAGAADGSEWDLVLRSEALGRRSETRVAFDARTAKPSVEDRLKISSDAELRSFHYGERAATRVRYHAEKKAFATKPREAWREKSREAQPYGDRRFTSPSTLLYILSASALNEPGDSLSIPVFTKGRSVVALAEVVEVTTANTVGLDGADAVDGQWPALKIRLRGRAVDGGTVDLDLFGLDGDLEILLDRRHRLPLSIRGSMDVVGTVDVRLRRATLATGS